MATERLLEGKVAVVTGAGRGIGREVALLMAEHGARVVVNDPGVAPNGSGFDAAPADQVVEEIHSREGQATANHDSVATMEGGEQIIKTALDTFGGLDVVMTCHGILRDRMVFNMTEEEWDAVVAVHLKGTFAVMKPAIIALRQRRAGRLITVTSTSGVWGNMGQANYGAAKDAIAGFTRCVALDVGRYGITVNSICPSADTRLTLGVPREAIERRTALGVQSARSAGIPQLERPPDAVAPLAVWLASDETADINGQIFYVQGGLVGLLNHPQAVRTVSSPGSRWTLSEIAAVFPLTLGMDLPNPAPPQT